MARRVRYLTDAEIEIMRVLWDSNKPVDSTQIQKELTGRTWALSTLMSALKRLETKEYIKRDDTGYRIMYSANISESEYLVKVLSNMHDVHKIHGTKPIEIIRGLCDINILSMEDIIEIRSQIDSIIANNIGQK